MSILRDQNGNAISLDDGLAIAMGSLSGIRQFGSIGERQSIGATVAGEDVWPGTAVSIPIPAAAGERLTLVSSSTADNGSTATGVLTVRIEYLDANGAEQTEDVVVNGTTIASTLATNILFVNDFYALTAGSGGVAAGNIILYKFGAASTIYNMIAAGGNKSLVINRRVPAGKTLYVTGWTCVSAISKDTSFRLRSNCTPDGSTTVGGFLFKRSALIRDASLSEIINPPIKIPSGAIVKVSAWATGAGGVGSASFNGILIDNVLAAKL